MSGEPAVSAPRRAAALEIPAGGDCLDDTEQAAGPDEYSSDAGSGPYAHITADGTAFALYDAYEEAEHW